MLSPQWTEKLIGPTIQSNGISIARKQYLNFDDNFNITQDLLSSKINIGLKQTGLTEIKTQNFGLGATNINAYAGYIIVVSMIGVLLANPTTLIVTPIATNLPTGILFDAIVASDEIISINFSNCTPNIIAVPNTYFVLSAIIPRA